MFRPTQLSLSLNHSFSFPLWCRSLREHREGDERIRRRRFVSQKFPFSPSLRHQFAPLLKGHDGCGLGTKLLAVWTRPRSLKFNVPPPLFSFLFHRLAPFGGIHGAPQTKGEKEKRREFRIGRFPRSAEISPPPFPSPMIVAVSRGNERRRLREDAPRCRFPFFSSQVRPPSFSPTPGTPQDGKKRANAFPSPQSLSFFFFFSFPL